MAEALGARVGMSRPAAGLSSPFRLRAWVTGLWSEPLLMLVLVGIALVAQALNMFQYPGLNRFDDEGVYLSQAWAVLREHQLAPYAYFYDHAPGGWLLLAAWMAISDGPRHFGLVLDSGRMFMLLLHLAMVPLLYRLARKLGCPVAAAAFAVVLFSISPLAVYYQRPVLLDNIMMFWLLLSLDILLDGWGRLSRLAVSGACFGLAVLSKETAVFLIPAAIFLAVQQRREHQGRFGVIGWLLPMAIVVSWYPVFALLRGEFLPAGQSLRFFILNIPAGSGVSLLESVKWQATRGGGGMFNLNNQFWRLLRTDWMVYDPVLVVGGALASLANVVRGSRDRRALAAGLLGALPLFYLARGGVVFDFYILFAIPFFCLNLAVLAPVLLRLVAAARHCLPLDRLTLRPQRTAAEPALVVRRGSAVQSFYATSSRWYGRLLTRAPRPRPALLLALGAVVWLAGYWQVGAMQPLYKQHAGQADREGLAWIKQHVPPQSLIVTGDDVWTDLHEPGLGGPAFPNVHSHWKVAADPAIRDGVFQNDWHTVDYLILTDGLRKDLTDSNNTIALEALQNAHLVKRWTSDSSFLELWKVDKPGLTEASLMSGSQSYLAQRFEHDGAYTSADGRVTSESQAYAMLRAVWSDDRAEFERVWGWTTTHLSNDDGLLAWLARDGNAIDKHSAADADTDAALALLMAGQRWHQQAFLDAGSRMVDAIWQGDVATIAGTPYLSGGDWTASEPVVPVNPSHLAPYAYHVFQAVDPNRDWQALIDSSYKVLFASSAAPLRGSVAAGLPPNWIGLDRSTGDIVPLDLGADDGTQYGWDAARTYWRVALDLRWFGDGRAKSYLEQAGFLRDEVTRDGKVAAVYMHDGSVADRAFSAVGNAGALGALLTLDTSAAEGLYASQLVGSANHDSAGISWGDPNDVYAQEWSWFATALYGNALPDIWDGKLPDQRTARSQSN